MTLRSLRLFALTVLASTCITGMLSAEGSLDKFFSNITNHANLQESPSPKTLESTKGSSYQYSQTFGSEKVKVTFPKKPSTKKKDGILMATIKTNKKEYGFLAPKPAVSVGSGYLFSLLLDDLNTSPYSVLDSYTYGDYSGEVIEVTSQDKKSKKIQQTKVVVTSDNFYLVSVEYPENKEDSSIEDFINSLEIID